MWPNMAKISEINPYAYAAGNPVNNVDPTGTSSRDVMFIPWERGIANGTIIPPGAMPGVESPRETAEQTNRVVQSADTTWQNFLDMGRKGLGVPNWVAGVFAGDKFSQTTHLTHWAYQGIWKAGNLLKEPAIKTARFAVETFKWASRANAVLTTALSVFRTGQLIHATTLTNAQNSRLAGKLNNTGWWDPWIKCGKKIADEIGDRIYGDQEESLKRPGGEGDNIVKAYGPGGKVTLLDLNGTQW